MGNFRIGNRQIIHSDTSTNHKPPPQEKLTLYYCLALKQYETFVPTSVSYKYVINSEQSLAAGIGHSTVISSRTLVDKECNSIVNAIITLIGYRFPKDEDANELDNNGNLIQRNLRRYYKEKYVITYFDKHTKKSIGGLSGELSYSDTGTTSLTTINRLRFPISSAYGIWEKFLDGYIDWQYFNSHPKFLRQLDIYSKLIG